MTSYAQKTKYRQKGCTKGRRETVRDEMVMVTPCNPSMERSTIARQLFHRDVTEELQSGYPII